MDELVRRYDNFRWLVSCAADRMMPRCIKESDFGTQELWRLVVFRLVGETKQMFIDVRWDCVRSAALSEMSKRLSQ